MAKISAYTDVGTLASGDKIPVVDVSATPPAAGTTKYTTPAELLTLTGTWTPYTPTLTNITQGDGTLDFEYIQIGKLAIVHGQFIMGSTSSISGVLGFSLPVTATAVAGLEFHGTILDSGTTRFMAMMVMATTTRLDVYASLASGTYVSQTPTSSTVPMTWTTSDAVEFYIMYEAA